MPDPIPVNRNVLQGQQQTQQMQQPAPPAAPVRPAPVRPAAATRPVANPATPQPPVRPRVTQHIPTPVTPQPVTQPHPVPPNQYGGWGMPTQPVPSLQPTPWPPRPTQPAPATQRPRRPAPAPARVAARPNVPARRNSSSFGRGLRRLLVSVSTLMVAIWIATFAFPSLLHYGIIAAIAQFVSNVFYTIGILAMWVYTHRDAILSFIIANPLLSACVSIIVLLAIVLLRKSIHS